MKAGVQKKVAPKEAKQTKTLLTASQKNVTETIKTNIESRWARLDARAKKFAMIFGSAVSFALALLYGPTIFYLLIFVIGTGAYALYPDKIDNWIDNHQFLLGFAAFGTMLSGPLGFIAGAWLGNFFEPNNNRLTATAAAVYQHTPTLLAVANTPLSLWQRIKNSCQNNWQWAKNKIAGQKTPQDENEDDKSNQTKQERSKKAKEFQRKTQNDKTLDKSKYQPQPQASSTSLWGRMFSYFSRNRSNAPTTIARTAAILSTANTETTTVKRTRAQAHAEAAQVGKTIAVPKPPTKNRTLKATIEKKSQQCTANQPPLQTNVRQANATTIPATQAKNSLLNGTKKPPHKRPKRVEVLSTQEDKTQAPTIIPNQTRLMDRLFSYLYPMPDFEEFSFGSEQSNNSSPSRKRAEKVGINTLTTSPLPKVTQFSLEREKNKRENALDHNNRQPQLSPRSSHHPS